MRRRSHLLQQAAGAAPLTGAGPPRARRTVGPPALIPRRGDGPGGTTPGSAGLGGQLGIFAFDIGAPIACYYLLRGAGLSPLWALGVGAALPALAATWQVVARRRVDPVAALVIATMAVSIALAALSHTPRLLLAKDGLVTGVWGAVFVVSIAARRPVAFAIARPLMEGRKIFTATSWDDLWDREPAFRRIWRVSSLVWGGALLADAALRILMAYRLPVDAVPGLSGVLWPCTFVVIQVVTNLYYRRAGLWRLLGARWLQPPIARPGSTRLEPSSWHISRKPL